MNTGHRKYEVRFWNFHAGHSSITVKARTEREAKSKVANMSNTQFTYQVLSATPL